MLHNERLCTHKTSPSKRKVLVHDMTPDGHNANGAKMLSGQKFASLYDKETRSYEPCLEWHFNGSGFSACDTIYEAWQKGMKVIHLLPSKVKEEAVGVKNQPGKRGKHQLIQHLNHKRSGRHYTVAEAMACPEKYQGIYEQGLGCRLTGIENHRVCHIIQNSAGMEAQHFRVAFDHIALLTGVRADYSFFPYTG